MKKTSPKTKILRETEVTRANISEQVAEIGANLAELNSVDVERKAKAFIALFKLTQTIDMQVELAAEQRAAEGLADMQDTHTSYDQIPPPNDDEMRAVRDRLNRLYARLRTPDDPKICTGSAQPDGVDGA